jgi:hypothetical protein
MVGFSFAGNANLPTSRDNLASECVLAARIIAAWLSDDSDMGRKFFTEGLMHRGCNTLEVSILKPAANVE